jgi:hypothetical protein
MAIASHHQHIDALIGGQRQDGRLDLATTCHEVDGLGRQAGAVGSRISFGSVLSKVSYSDIGCSTTERS